MHTACVNSKDNAKSNDSDHIFVVRENTCLKHRCPLIHFEYLAVIRLVIAKLTLNLSSR